MAYEIELTAPSLSKFERTLDQSLEKADRLATKMENLGAASRAASSESVGSSGDARRSARAFMTMESLKGPYARAETAGTRLSYYSANNIGGAQLQDAQLEAARAQRAVMKAEKEGKPLSRGDAINDLLMTSRLSVSDGGVSMMPLVNRMMSYRSASALFGEGAGGAIAGLAGPLAGAAAAIYGMTEAAKAYSAFVKDSASGHFVGGGGIGISAQAQGIASYLGTTGEAMADKAVQFGSFMRGGTPAAGYFRQHGLRDLGWRQADKMSGLMRAMDILRGEPDESRAIIMARGAGLSQELSRIRDLPQGDYDSLKSLYRPVSASERRSQASNDAEWESTKGFWSTWVTQPLGFIGREMLGGLNPLHKNLAQRVLLDNALGWADNNSSGNGRAGASATLAKLDKAAESLADAGRTLKEGAETIGAGPRSRGAYPKAWQNALQMEDALTGQAAMLGAFSI